MRQHEAGPSDTRRGVALHGDPTSGSVVYALVEGPDERPGDAEFFVDDPTRFVQMRPVLKHEECPGRFFGPSDRMLVCTIKSKIGLQGLCAHEAGLSGQHAQNVALAVKQVEKFDFAAGLMFRRALQGIPPHVTYDAMAKSFRPGAPGAAEHH